MTDRKKTASGRTRRKTAAKKKRARPKKPAAGKKKTAAKKPAGKKKTAAKKKKKPPPAPPLVPDIVDGLVLILASGATQSAARDYATQTAQLDPAAAARHVDEAARRIALAASYDKQQELGTAYTRLNMLFQRANGGQDFKSALAAQKELNRLLSLYSAPAGSTPGDPAETGNADAATELDAVRSHLEPLQLADAGSSVEELARLAALSVLGADL